jgi:PTS system sucrose-specific IIC component
MKTRNTRLKKVIKGALPVGLLGIGEPLIFGVTLPLGKPFWEPVLAVRWAGR